MLVNKTFTLLPYKNKNKLNEIFQAVEIRMAYAKKTPDGIEQLHDSVKCRDYLGDALLSEQIQREVSIYGFSYDGTKTKIDRDKTRLLLFFPDQKTLDNFNNNQELVNKIEHDLKLSQTRCYKIADKPLALLIEADKFWLRATLTISFYTFLLKCMGYKFNGLDNWIKQLVDRGTKGESGTELSYAKSTLKAFPYYTKFIKKLVYNLPYVNGYKKLAKDHYQTVSNTHDRSGFVFIVSKWAQENKEHITASRLKKLMENPL